MSKLRIFLAEDPAMIREGPKRLIARSDMKAAGEAGYGEESVTRLPPRQPAAVMRLSGGHGSPVLRLVKCKNIRA